MSDVAVVDAATVEARRLTRKCFLLGIAKHDVTVGGVGGLCEDFGSRENTKRLQLVSIEDGAGSHECFFDKETLALEELGQVILLQIFRLDEVEHRQLHDTGLLDAG